MAGSGEMVVCVQSMTTVCGAAVVEGRRYTVDGVFPAAEAGVGIPKMAYTLMERETRYLCECCGDDGGWLTEWFRDLEKPEPELRSVRRLEPA